MKVAKCDNTERDEFPPEGQEVLFTQETLKGHYGPKMLVM